MQKMKSRKKGQSLVEMALIGPLLLITVFGIIEIGYLIFAYATVSQAARTGAEQAARLPPDPSQVDVADDACVRSIYAAVEREAPLFLGADEGGINEGRNISDQVIISYPNGDDSYNSNQLRGPVQVRVDYTVEGITPAFDLLGLRDQFTMSIVVRRTITQLAPTECRP